MSEIDSMRLDKWLWCARFYKTRSLAVDEIGKGRVTVNKANAKASREVRQDSKGFVASYIDVDASNVTTELRPGASGQYVGFIRYQEKVMECRGKTKQEAITTASCEQVKARNLNELIRYDGSVWQY